MIEAACGMACLPSSKEAGMAASFGNKKVPPSDAKVLAEGAILA
jgi:hypothetical protein